MELHWSGKDALIGSAMELPWQHLEIRPSARYHMFVDCFSNHSNCIDVVCFHVSHMLLYQLSTLLR